jgi:anti-anti-sigma regulatory factor
MKLERGQTNGGGVVIAIHGELDLSTTYELRQELLRAIKHESAAVTTIDREHCTKRDRCSTGLVRSCK